MQLTSKDANKLLKQFQVELVSLKRREDDASSFLAATIEDVECVRPDYNFLQTQKMIKDVETKIIKLKHAINVFNVNTVVEPFGKTIDEMLIYIPQLSLKKDKLNTMRDRPKMVRYDNSYHSNIIDYKYINYDLNEVNNEYKKVEDELAKAQIALDKINVSKTFDVEF